MYIIIVFREKYGLVRNDFLDCMMELRQASNGESQGDVQTEKNAKTGTTYSKLQQILVLGVTEYYVKLLEDIKFITSSIY